MKKMTLKVQELHGEEFVLIINNAKLSQNNKQSYCSKNS